MRFNWKSFCSRHDIPFVTHGANVAHNNINIQCPFCGEADPSEHLGLSLDVSKPYWGCFRNQKHRGKNPIRLVAALLHTNFEAAKDILEHGSISIDMFDEVVSKLKYPDVVEESKQQQTLIHVPREFRPFGLRGDNLYEQRFVAYLSARGFGNDAAHVAVQAGLWYALTGDYAWRLLFPVYNVDKNGLEGWQGRDITGASAIRYKACAQMGKDVLLTRTSQFRKIVVVEGPFDWLKFYYYGAAFGVRCVATLGTSVTQWQTDKLRKFVESGFEMYIVFDSDATSQGLVLAEETGAKWKPIKGDFKDPGDMTKEVIAKFLGNF